MPWILVLLSSTFILVNINQIYRVSVKSLYHLKILLLSEIMRYRNEGYFILVSVSSSFY